MKRSFFRDFVSVAAPAALLAGCPANNGNNPPADHIFYPIAAVVAGTDARCTDPALAARDPRRLAETDCPFLYVVNSDFDLAYNGSTVTAIDLAAVRRKAVNPGNCMSDPESAVGEVCSDSQFIREEFTRKVNPFAIDAAAATYVNNVQRLYVLVRGGNSLSWFDIQSNGRLDCGSGAPSDSVVKDFCTSSYQAGTDPAQSPAGARLPFDPASLSIDPECGWIAVTHQSADPNLPRATLFRDRVFDGRVARANASPVLLNVVGGLAPGLSAITLLPRAMSGAPTGRCPESSRSTWISTSRADPSLTFLQAYPGNATLNDARPYLYRSNAVPLTGLNTGSDNRAIALDPTPGRQRAFVVSRRPEALLTVDLGNLNAPSVVDAVALPYGPSRLAPVYDPTTRRTLVYVVSYDARRVAVVDPAERRIVTQIQTNRGPHDIVRDPVAPFLYVVDFLDASIEVIDIRPTTGDGSPNPRYNRRVLTLARLAQ